MGFVFWMLWVMVRVGFGMVLGCMLMMLVGMKSMAMGGPFCGGEQLHGACPPRGSCEPLRGDEQLKLGTWQHGGGDHDGVSLFLQSF